ncbi:MAG TPA: IS21 family transposase, partial [Candidatus Glassbacteria bacterium]|nr:IS21 family transposase [Candidatus Glassbacteria bacterium]
GETVEVRLYAEALEIWYSQRRMETIPRLRGENHARIQYRHIIDWLVRKPGAFENYRYRAALFPSSRFRMAYDTLRQRQAPRQADREYLSILYLAAYHSETQVEQALHHLLDPDQVLTAEAVEAWLQTADRPPAPPQVTVAPVDLAAYDALLEGSR